MQTLWKRSVAVIVLAVMVLSGNAAALSAGQRQLMQSGVRYYNLAETVACGGSPSAGTTGSSTVTTDMASFIDTYGQFAFNVGKKNGIPYDSILAQGSLESNYGQSGLNQKANNFFGIKAGSSWTGPTVTMPTREERPDGSSYYVDSKFEAYPSPEAGFQGYADFLKRNPRYVNVFNHQHDPIGYFQALKDAGYATEDAYVTLLTGRLKAVQEYVASKNMFIPESQVVYDVQPTPTPGVTPGSGGGGCVGTPGSGGSVVAVAIQEAQLWKTGQQDFKKYTGGRAENWCADFVSWVYKQAGRPFTPTDGVAMLDGWQITAVSEMQKYLQAKGQYWEKSANAPAPQPGDIIIHKNGASHTNLVVEANGYMVKTLGGNQASNSIYSSKVTMNETAFDIRTGDGTISGWGRLP